MTVLARKKRAEETTVMTFGRRNIQPTMYELALLTCFE